MHICWDPKTSMRMWLCSYKESKALLWPPAANDLEIISSEELLLHELVKFLNGVLDGYIDVDNEYSHEPWYINIFIK